MEYMPKKEPRPRRLLAKMLCRVLQLTTNIAILCFKPYALVRMDLRSKSILEASS